MKKHVLSFLFLFFVASAWSQTDTLCKSYYDYTATNILLPDHDTIWVGTGGGLIKQTISGTILNIYSSANSGVANNFVCALAIDSSGNILVGTAFQGVQRFDRHNAWTVLYPAIIATSLCYQVTGIVATGNGIWALGGAAPLSYYDGSIWTQYNSSNSIIPTNGGLTSIQKDGDTIWVSGSSAANTPYFIKIFGGVWTMYDYSTGLPSCVTSASFAISADHKIWMAGQNGVILCNGATYDTTTWQVWHWSWMEMAKH